MNHEPGSLANKPSPGRLVRWARWVGRNWARLTYGRRIEPHWLELTRQHIQIADLPSAYEGFRVVHMTDFHGGPGLPSSYLQEAVELANAQSPDLIALTGDFIHQGFGHIDQVVAVLRRLAARHGVFAVLGNHDFSVRNALGRRRHRQLHQFVAEALERSGIPVLRNRWHRLEHQGEHLHIVGVDDLWCRACDPAKAFSGVPPHLPSLLLAHNPLTVEQLNGRRCDLVLSGHTHGGQVNWPGLGRFLLGKNGKRYAAGLYRHHDTQLYVNRGVGYGWRFRFGVRPEVAVLHLHRLQSAAATSLSHAGI